MAVWTLWPLLVLFFGLAGLASLISVRLGISVALLEIVLGAFVGNAFGVTVTGQDWIPVLASLGGVVLTFLAGTEIDPGELRRNWVAALSIGVLSFVVPFAAASGCARFLLDWSVEASLLAGVALSTTSVAIVYVVLVESGLTNSATGKLVLAACFITDLATVLALSGLFVPPNAYVVLLAVAVTAAALVVPPLATRLFERVQGKSSEPEVRFLLFVIVGLGALAVLAGSFAVLPAYVLGFAMASVLQRRRDVLLRLRAASFILLTPFFFLYAGLNISAPAVVAGAALILLFFVVKVGAKIVGVWPTSRLLKIQNPTYVTLLMSTGLTFGTIASLYGLSAGIIDQSQFSVLLTVVLLTAIVPTLIAQRWFYPTSPPSAAGPPGAVHPAPTPVS